MNLGNFPASNSCTVNPALSEVLDAPQPDVEMNTSGKDGEGLGDIINGVSKAHTAVEDFAREQQARLAAEADREDQTRRLQVATVQLAEYGEQKHAESDRHKLEVENLSAHLSRLLSKQDVSAVDLNELKNKTEKLAKILSEAQLDAMAFACQARKDAEQIVKVQGVLDTSKGLASRANGNGATHPSEDEFSMEEEERVHDSEERVTASSTESGDVMSERAKWIPLRLNMEERKMLRLLEAAMSVSEYTDKVDVLSYKSKTQRMHAQLKDICAILSGLLVASDYKQGQKLLVNRNFADNEIFFQDCFEVGRRHKIMNPEKMRSEYGKLVYLLMDSQMSDVQQLLEFQCVRPLSTVYAFLENRNATHLLKDNLVPIATAEISADGKPRSQVDREIKAKERARETLADKYCSSSLSQDEIRHCMYSIADNDSYLRFNRDPVDQMITYLHTHFHADSYEEGLSLAISSGMEGARLTHNHQRQYRFVLQSLSLWRDISNHMFKLWGLAEQDLLGQTNSYRLTNTGQGLNRVQQAPKVSQAMNGILSQCQQKLGQWVGSSVVHLGDHNVPNALMFIDKYTQVPRILNPIVLVVKQIPELMKDANIRAYITKTFGGQDILVKIILSDFYRHAFDGSGADNFFDAGSCIDGRLTSAWNWCAKLEKKSYFPIFKLAGFSSFDGDFQK
eukprot:CAMPEP_0196585418 /NCGR_PEP_ID=MMETSP1081-20130531/50565_1 /TAXON_ID=36882 /ORGANISM="Pyramimonas amylifera, Strain CCMP720" /LENGTH=678 /DNA_ID=CAMNT_0041906951 /DNA_START=96 /DNA_END=2132 /DNA_ORIENTATION=+